MSDSSSSAISSLASEYRERYHAVDPHVPIAYAVPERKQFSSREHLDDTHVSRSEHFADLSIPAGIRHVLWALLWETERIQAARSRFSAMSSGAVYGRALPRADSGPCRPPIPVHAGPPFRLMPVHDSGPCRASRV
jgi:hypothetical protein